MRNPGNLRIAVFISPHGYGHAARAAAIMEAVHELTAAVEFEIFTTVPRWFFDDSLSAPFSYHSVLTDIGLAQETPLRANLRETLARLNHFLPFDRSRITNLASMVKNRGCRLIICDIAPMGILVAKEANISSVLVENFTWDWIYEAYLGEDSEVEKHIHYLHRLFELAHFHVQTEPVCRRQNADLTTFPVSRKTKRSRSNVRRSLGIPENAKVVTITMGGTAGPYPFLDQLTSLRDCHFIIPGANNEMQVLGNVVLLPRYPDCFHPDLVHASDAVVGKVGYSTLAETYDAGLPFGYVAPNRLRESQVLISFIETQMKGLAIEEHAFYDGIWISRLPDLLVLPRTPREGPNGAEQVARFICGLIHSHLS